MKLSPMRFKDYVWPHNPAVYSISYKRDLVSHRVPFGLYALQDMGREHRVLKGSGEFSGPGAYAEFQKLASVFYEATPGPLIHPLWMSTKAWFAALSLQQEPVEDYVKYSFEFWECCGSYREDIEQVERAEEPAQTATSAEHTVQAGESIWTIAASRGTTAEAIIAKNPAVKNPNLIRAGQILMIN